MSDFPDSNPSLSVEHHPRLSEFNRLVYPVVSRRSGGLSIGINLNPKKECSFNCIYCQVDRSLKIEKLEVNTDQIKQELSYWLEKIKKENWTYQNQPLKDISFAGDGEPSLAKNLPEILNAVIDIKNKYQLDECKINIFTNGSRIHRRDLWKILPYFFDNGGDIWFKLDFWDEKSFSLINRSSIPFKRIKNNLIELGKSYPIILQSCLFKWKDEQFSVHKYQSYCQFINKLLENSVQIKQVQVYTLARKPAEISATPWTDEQMDQLDRFIKENVPGRILTVYKKKAKVE